MNQAGEARSHCARWLSGDCHGREDCSCVPAACHLCRRPAVGVTGPRITITVDRARAIRVYRFTFNREYTYCSRACAESFFTSWPDLSLSYLTVTSTLPQEHRP